MLVEMDTYEAASQVHDLLVKTHPADREKIELTRRLISEHLDIDKCCRASPTRRHPRARAQTRPTSAAPVRTFAQRSVGSDHEAARRVDAEGSRSSAPKET